MRLKALDDCINEFARLPGVGRKTATRLAMHLLKMKKDDVKRFADTVATFRDRIIFCSICGGLSESEICPICQDKARDIGELCVVEEAKDLFVIEQVGYFAGRYHVLGGKISPLDGIGPNQLRIAELLARIEKESVREVILATNPDVDGETTAIYITRMLEKFPDLRITKLASGIPLGTHIEYADEMTVLRAIEGRREI